MSEITMIGRKLLPDRRENVTCEVTHMHAWGPRKYLATYGLDEHRHIREVFCWPEKSGSDLDAVISDACIGLSHALQYGASVAQLADALGQLRPEGAKEETGPFPPASALGSILRVGATIEALERGLLTAAVKETAV